MKVLGLGARLETFTEPLSHPCQAFIELSSVAVLGIPTSWSSWTLRFD